jgi:hypothetical protein
MHIIAVVIVWIVAATASALDAEVAISAYLITLTAIWNYRRELRKTPSGWYRLGAGMTVLWLGFGILVWTNFAQEASDPMSVLAMAWAFTALGLSPWLLGWLIQWIREGFAHRTGGDGNAQSYRRPRQLSTIARPYRTVFYAWRFRHD